MIESITVINYQGESITLTMRSPEQSGFFVRSIEGLGPAKGTINMSESLSVDGGIYNSGRITFRNIVMNLGFVRGQNKTAEDLRLETYRYFPVKRVVGLIIETENRYLYTSGYVETNDPDIFTDDAGTTISIICPDAYLRALNTIETVFSGVEPAFEFPFSNEDVSDPLLVFGNLILSQEKNLYYDGDAQIGITLKAWFSGTVTDFKAFNLTAQQQIWLDDDKVDAILGSSIAAGDELTITTQKGNKTITIRRNGVDYNMINALVATAPGATWFTIDPGDNVFYVTAGTGANYIQSIIEHYPAYEGA